MMNANKIPQTDSIRELAEFWDTHDLTDLEAELEEVTEPVFEWQKAVRFSCLPELMAARKPAGSAHGSAGSLRADSP